MWRRGRDAKGRAMPEGGVARQTTRLDQSGPRPQQTEAEAGGDRSRPKPQQAETRAGGARLAARRRADRQESRGDAAAFGEEDVVAACGRGRGQRLDP